MMSFNLGVRTQPWIFMVAYRDTTFIELEMVWTLDSRQTWGNFSTSLALWLWTFLSFRCQRKLKNWSQYWT